MTPLRTLLIVTGLAVSPAAWLRAATDQHIEMIRKFFAVMAAEEHPTIAQFEELFGPHNEDEIALQLRYEGYHGPSSEMASEEIVSRVNKRLLAPARYPSLFLCMLRREMPEVRSGRWEILDAARRVDGVVGKVFKIKAGEKVLFIYFESSEPGIMVGDSKGNFIGANRFLHLCAPGKCCEVGVPD